MKITNFFLSTAFRLNWYHVPPRAPVSETDITPGSRPHFDSDVAIIIMCLQYCSKLDLGSTSSQAFSDERAPVGLRRQNPVGAISICCLTQYTASHTCSTAEHNLKCSVGIDDASTSSMVLVLISLPTMRTFTLAAATVFIVVTPFLWLRLSFWAKAAAVQRILRF